MSKQPIDPVLSQVDDLPPPYTSTVDEAFASSQSAVPSPSLFTPQLSNLRHLIHSQQAAHTSAREERDNQILALLVPHVEDFISSIATFTPTPTKAEAILVPSDAVGHEWQLSDEQETGEGEIRQVILVERHNKLRGDTKRALGPEDGASHGGAGSALWWNDEDMARRLAKHLQPHKNTPERIVTSSQSKPSPKQESKPSRWKLFTKGTAPETQASTSAAPSTSNHVPTEDAVMTTKAEEVTFRRENDFGIWESNTGWGILVRVRLQRQ